MMQFSPRPSIAMGLVHLPPCHPHRRCVVALAGVGVAVLGVDALVDGAAADDVLAAGMVALAALATPVAAVGVLPVEDPTLDAVCPLAVGTAPTTSLFVVPGAAWGGAAVGTVLPWRC